MQKPIIETHDLSVGYSRKAGKQVILHQNIRLGLKQGEITCLLGPNGSGKSTLIRTLAGFQKAISGGVLLNGHSITSLSASALARQISVVLTDQLTAAGNLKVLDMVALGRSPYTGFLGRLDREDQHAVEQALQSTGILHLHKRMFDTLSDGERQKVMIAKSLAQETPVILLDEPTAFLDFPSKVEIMQLLREAAWDQHKAILLSTHDINLALQFADSLWLMGKNLDMKTGVPEDLVLAGELGNFFNRRQTNFDLQTGTFKFQTAGKGNVRITGEGIRMQWLAHALERKGFVIVKEQSSRKNHITIGEGADGSYILTDKITQQNKKFQNISGVLAFAVQYRWE